MLFRPRSQTLQAGKFHRHRIDSIKKSRVDERIFHKPAAFGIGRNIFKLVAKILLIANTVLMKSYLPDLTSVLCPHFV